MLIKLLNLNCNFCLQVQAQIANPPLVLNSWVQDLLGVCVTYQKKKDNVSHFFSSTDVDTDMLLRKDLVTLDEAVKTANNAVLLAINAISVLISVSYFSLVSVWLLELLSALLSLDYNVDIFRRDTENLLMYHMVL